MSRLRINVTTEVEEKKNNSPTDAPKNVDSAYRSAVDKHGEINYSDLVFQKKVAAGGYKEVYVGSYKGVEVAIGVVQTAKLSPEDIADIEKESEVLSQIRHDNIVKFIGIAKQYDDGNSDVPSQTCFVTEYCPHGDLSDYMKANQKPSLKQQLGIMYDIAFGCAYLHGRRPAAVIHRDLKSLNILVDGEGKAKISDFGLAKIKKKARALMHSVVGTTNWQAPEVVLTFIERLRNISRCGQVIQNTPKR
jgi:serine/threonine protein kinase